MLRLRMGELVQLIKVRIGNVGSVGVCSGAAVSCARGNTPILPSDDAENKILSHVIRWLIWPRWPDKHAMGLPSAQTCTV